MDLQITYETGPRRERLEAILSQLTALLAAHQAELGSATLDRYHRDEQALRRRMARPFNLVVVGEFKRGKSTLVNALLGREIVSSDVTPETVAVQELHHGPEGAQAVLEDGGKVSLGLDQLTSNEITALRRRLPCEIDHLRIQIEAPELQGLVVTDTPGTGDLMWRFDERVQRYLPQADAVLYVVSGLSPLSESERSFLELSLRPMELAKVCFVVNMVDNLPSEEDAGRVVERIASQLRPQFPDSPVFGLSAIDELDRVTGEERADPERAPALEARFAALREHLERSVLLNRDEVRLANALREARRLLQGVRRDLQSLDGALGSESEELQQRLQAAREGSSELHHALSERHGRLREQNALLQERSDGWMEGFVDRLGEQLVPAVAEHEHSTVQKHLPYFLNARLRSAWMGCLESHKAGLFDLLGELGPHSEATESELAEGVQGAAAGAAFHPPQLTGAARVLVGLGLVTMFLGVGGSLMRGLFTAFGALDKTAGDAERAEAFREHLQEALPELRSSLRATNAEASERLLAQAAAALDEAFEQDLARQEEVAAQALALQAQGSARIEASRERMAPLAERLGTLATRLEELAQA